MKTNRLGWFIQYLFSVLLIALFFVILIYRFILPTFHDTILKKRTDSARQVVLAARSVLQAYHGKAAEGLLSEEAAREEAAALLEALRFGEGPETRLWIISDRPDMIRDPLRPGWEGRYLGEWEDREGRLFFREIAAVAREEGAGFVDSSRLDAAAPGRLRAYRSFGAFFAPWGWVVGTDVSLDGVQGEVQAISRQLVRIAVGTAVGAIVLMGLVTLRAGRMESEKLTAQEEQLRTQRLFRGIFLHARNFVAVLEPDGGVVKVNRESLQLIGRSEEEVAGRKIWELPWWNSSPEEKALAAEAVRKSAGGILSRHEAFLSGPDGKLRSFELTFAPIFDEGGRVRYILPEGREVTRRKETEEALNRRIRELEQELRRRKDELKEFLVDLEGTQQQLIQSEKMAALGRLVAGVAHEINTPLGISVTAASFLDDRTRAIRRLLEEEALTEEEFNGFLDTAVESSEMILANLERAAGQIKVFKQVAVDQSDEAIRSFGLKGYIREVVKSLQPELKKKPCLIDILCPEDLEVVTYPGAFSQILSNLIMNSLKHGFRNRDAGTITLECRRDKNRLVLDYRDNGQGIPEGTEDKLFEPFYTTARSDGGTGLGLHIVYNLVMQKLKGSITVNTRQEAGLGFLIDFPVE